MIGRRSLTALLLAGSATACTPAASTVGDDAVVRRIGDLEAGNGGRLGVAIVDTARPRPRSYRGDERFPLCSTHKLLSVAFVLARVDRGDEDLDRRVVYPSAAIVAHSPITERHVGPGGITVGELCAASLTVSDNAAANLLLDSFGGPAELTGYLRSIGDDVTRLDRREPALNDVAPGDPRDTTTPNAMLATMGRMVIGDALSPASRARLKSWLVLNTTGGKRIRAGVPVGWRVGDKTGSGADNATNDVAILWPPNRAPILVAAYYTGADRPIDARDAVLAAVGRLAATV